MSFNMVTRRNAMANKSAQSVGSKRPYSGSYVTGANEPPTTSRVKKDAVKPMSNPWTRRIDSSKGEKLVEPVEVEDNGKEVSSDGDEDWKEVKSRRKGNRVGAVSPKEIWSPKPAQKTPVIPYDVDWPVLMKVGTHTGPVQRTHQEQPFKWNRWSNCQRSRSGQALCGGHRRGPESKRQPG